MQNPIRKVFDFKKQEIPIVVLLFLFFFLIIAVFQILRPLKKGLFVDTYGAHLELYAKLGNIVVAALAVAVFSILYNRLSRQRLIYVLCAFFIACFVVLPPALASPGPLSIWGFYFMGDLISTMMVAAFWAYLTDISDAEQAKRLFGAIGGGGVVGGWAGIAWARALLDRVGMGGLLLLSAVLMALVAVIIFWVERLIRRTGAFRKPARLRAVPPESAKKESKARAAIEGARLVMRSRYLAAIVGIMAFYEIASQTIDYQFSSLSEALEGVAETQAFMVNVYFYANLLAVIVQVFLVSLIMRKLGVVTALMVLPVAVFSSSTAFLASPTLLVASFLNIFDNGLNYSIQQTARESLYVPTTSEEKYKARAFTNMFVQRLAKGIGIVAIIGLGAMEIAVRYLSLITMAVAIAVALCGIYAGRRFTEKIRLQEAVRPAA